MPRKVDVSDETWEKLRVEYISSTSVSIRGLQKKYGIPYNAIRNKAEENDWLSQREELKKKTTQKSIDLMADFNANECAKAFCIANKLLDKVAESVELLDAEDRAGIRQLTACIKDLKEIGVFRSELDKAEQMARIKKLQKDAEEEKTDTNITVIIDDEVKKYCR